MTYPKTKLGICQVCKKQTATELHHLFSKGTKKGWRYKLYGELLHDPRNLMPVCDNCHKWKPIPKYTEKEFCQKLGIKVRSKIG
jgi:5-methylcytosine-specific restriction endonuclease McrA